MSKFLAGAVELDRCGFCRGLWFDGGELEQVLKKRLIGELDPDTSSSRRCAQCKVALQPAVLGQVRVEVCTTCRGVFLDDGELVALNGGQQVKVQTLAPRSEPQVKDDVMQWLHALGA